MNPQLIVSLDPVGVLREPRRGRQPDPSQVAVLAEVGGADGIAVQIRRDNRFIRERDLYLLRETVNSRLIVESPPLDEAIARLIEVKPAQVTLVADAIATETIVTPIDLVTGGADFREMIGRLRAANIAVGCLLDSAAEQVRAAAKAGADAVLLDGHKYGEARSMREAQDELDRIDQAAQVGRKQNVTVAIGRGLTYNNIGPIIELGLIDEYSIGHAIAARALMVGYEQAVRDMRALIRGGVGATAS